MKHSELRDCLFLYYLKKKNMTDAQIVNKLECKFCSLAELENSCSKLTWTIGCKVCSVLKHNS